MESYVWLDRYRYIARHILQVTDFIYIFAFLLMSTNVIFFKDFLLRQSRMRNIKC